jgi:hypothetical protein
MELTQLQRQSIMTVWRNYQDAVGAARQQTHLSIDVLRGQTELWAGQEQQACGAYTANAGPAQAAAEVR